MSHSERSLKCSIALSLVIPIALRPKVTGIEISPTATPTSTSTTNPTRTDATDKNTAVPMNTNLYSRLPDETRKEPAKNPLVALVAIPRRFQGIL